MTARLKPPGIKLYVPPNEGDGETAPPTSRRPEGKREVWEPFATARRAAAPAALACGVVLVVLCVPGHAGLMVTPLIPLAALASRGLRPWLVATSVLWPDLVCLVLASRVGDRFTWGLALAACILSTPLQARVLLWGRRVEGWDPLDSVVLIATPVAFVLHLAVIVSG